MSEKGFIKLDRAIKYWRYKTRPNYVALWVHLLVEANHETRKVFDTVVPRGWLLTSYESLAKGTGLSIQTVRTILKHLDGEELTIKSTNKYTLINIVKYDEYQGRSKKVNTPSNNQLTNNQQTTNNKQETKEAKELKNIYNSIPVYDTSKNETMSKEQEEELLELTKGQA